MLRKPIRKKRCTNSRVMQAIKPLSCRPPGKSATARLRPVTAKSPLLTYAKGSKASPWTKRRKLCACWRPCCMAGWATRGCPLGQVTTFSRASTAGTSRWWPTGALPLGRRLCVCAFASLAIPPTERAGHRLVRATELRVGAIGAARGLHLVPACAQGRGQPSQARIDCLLIC